MASSSQYHVESPTPSLHPKPFGVHSFPDDRDGPQYENRTIYEVWDRSTHCVIACSLDNHLVGPLTEAAMWLLLDRSLMLAA